MRVSGVQVCVSSFIVMERGRHSLNYHDTCYAEGPSILSNVSAPTPSKHLEEAGSFVQTRIARLSAPETAPKHAVDLACFQYL